MQKKKDPFNQTAYMKDYYQRKYTKVSVLLRKEEDADIIRRLKHERRKSDFIRKLLRKEIMYEQK